MIHPDAPARSVQLSDGTTWRYEPDTRQWWNEDAGRWPIPFTLHDPDDKDDELPLPLSHLTADDHRKIADVLDPQPSSDGLASQDSARLDWIVSKATREGHEGGWWGHWRLPNLSGWDWTPYSKERGKGFDHTTVRDAIDADMHKEKESPSSPESSPTAEGGTT